MKRTYSPATGARAHRCGEAEIDGIVAKYHETRNTNTVARELKMSRTTVLKYMTDPGVRTTRTISEREVDRAVQLNGDGLSCAAVARQLGFDSKTIAKELRARGAMA